MPDRCASCSVALEQGTWKRRLLLAGAFVFCPCHLPVTLGVVLVGLGAAGLDAGAAWLKPVVYGTFTVAFLVFAVWFARLMHRRHRLRQGLEDGHAHSPAAGHADPAPVG